MHEPIIRSLLDMDFYKFTMGQLVFLQYPHIPVRYAFKNRTKLSMQFNTAVCEEDLRRELDHARTLRSNNSELRYLHGINAYGERIFVEPYLDFFQGLQLPSYELERVGSSYSLEFAGPWSTTIYWETIALSIVNELYYRTMLGEFYSPFQRDVIEAQGRINLAEKIKLLKQRPDIKFSDFGTRRRFSRAWQEYVVRTMAAELPENFLGTSNVKLAMDLGLVPIGTAAHEMYMVMSGIRHDSDEQIRASHNEVLRDWWNLYGHGLSVALTDTYGTDFFFRDMTAEQARAWKGLRQDSGDPVAFGESAIAFYERHGIDPTEKLIVFSDGLDVATIIRLDDRFAGRIKVSFGWGTNLTNDLGLKPLSLVVKAVEANGHGTVKLSDNLAKATGQPEDVERFKRIFGYTGNSSQDCTY